MWLQVARFNFYFCLFVVFFGRDCVKSFLTRPICCTAEKMVHQSKLYTSLNTTLSKYHGVHVLWAPSGSGKTTYLTYYLQELQRKNEFHIGFLKAERLKERYHPMAWLRMQCGFQDSATLYLNDVLPTDKPTILVIDQADFILAHPCGQTFVTRIAEDAANSQQYQVILSVQDPELVKMMAYQWYDNKKINFIPVNFAFTEQQVDFFLTGLCKTVWKPENALKLREIGMISRNPGVIIAASQSERYVMRNVFDKMADEAARAWQSSHIV